MALPGLEIQSGHRYGGGDNDGPLRCLKLESQDREEGLNPEILVARKGRGEFQKVVTAAAATHQDDATVMMVTQWKVADGGMQEK